MPWFKRRKWDADQVGWQVWFLQTRCHLVVSFWESLQTGLSSWSCDALTTPAGNFDPHFLTTHLPSHPHLCQYNTMCLSLKIQQSHLFYWKYVCAHLVAQSCPALCDPWTVAHQAHLSMRILQTRILAWVPMPSSRGSSQPRDWTQVSDVAGGFFTVWATREVLHI